MTLLRALLLALVAAAVLPARALCAELAEGIAAVVDDEVILLSELDASAQLVIRQISRQQGEAPPAAVVDQIRREALQKLIDAKIMEKFAERVQVAATEQEIDETVAGIAADEGLTPDQVYSAAAAQGLGREQYRRELGNQINEMKIMSGAIRNRVEVSDEEVQELFKQRYQDAKPGMRARVRHILLPWPPPDAGIPRDQARGFAKQIRDRAIATGDFAALAAQFSRGPTASSGGLTTLRESDLGPEFQEALFAPPPGSITPVIENDIGLNIFQILERFDPASIELAEVESALRNELGQRRVGSEFDAWLEEQRAQYFIKVVAPGLK